MFDIKIFQENYVDQKIPQKMLVHRGEKNISLFLC